MQFSYNANRVVCTKGDITKIIYFYSFWVFVNKLCKELDASTVRDEVSNTSYVDHTYFLMLV